MGPLSRPLGVLLVGLLLAPAAYADGGGPRRGARAGNVVKHGQSKRHGARTARAERRRRERHEKRSLARGASGEGPASAHGEGHESRGRTEPTRTPSKPAADGQPMSMADALRSFRSMMRDARTDRVDHDPSPTPSPGPKGRSRAGSTKRALPKRPPLRVVDRPSELGLEKFPRRAAVLGRGMTWGVPDGTETEAQRLGELIAERRWPLATGGGGGLPERAARAAYREGGETWAVTADSRGSAPSFRSDTSVLYPTGTGPAEGSIEREAPLTAVANLRFYVNGAAGTFGELVAGLHTPGVLAFLSRSGGVAGHYEEILRHIDVPGHVRIVAAADAASLVKKAERALSRLGSAHVETTPRNVYRPGKRKRAIPEMLRQSRTVYAFLMEDGGRASTADRRKMNALMDGALEGNAGEVAPMAVFPEGKRGLKLALRAARKRGRDAVVVSHRDGRDEVVPGESGVPEVRIVRTGKGPGAGEFAAHREVIEDAEVVLITSAHYKNLAGLTFALRAAKNPIIGVLELSSTGSDGIHRMIDAAGVNRMDVVRARSPRELIKKVRAELDERYSVPTKGDDDIEDWLGL